MKTPARLAALLALAAALWNPPYAAAAQPYTEFLNRPYGNGQTLDLYIPAAPRKKTAIIFIHGGGFVSGAKEDLQGYAKLYAQGGFVTATINYRLAPASPAPAALVDVQLAMLWLRLQAGNFGYEPPQKLVLVGYSAGANLAMMAGLADNAGVSGVVSGAGPSDLRSLVQNTPHEQLRKDVNGYLAGQNPDAYSPLYRVTAGDPPVFLFHGDQDAFIPVSQSVVMAQRLKDSQVPVLLRVFPGVGHEIMLPNPYLGQLIEEMTQFILRIEQGS